MTYPGFGSVLRAPLEKSQCEHSLCPSERERMAVCITHALIYPATYSIDTFSTYLVFLTTEGLKIGEILENAEKHEEKNITFDLITKK